MMGYHQASEDTVPKVASILSAYPCPPKPTTSPPTAASSGSGIAHANVEEVENPAEEAPLPNANVEEVQSPAERVEEAPLPNAPVLESESSPAKVSVTSSQSAVSVDLLADCKSESGASELEYEERPLGG